MRWAWALFFLVLWLRVVAIGTTAAGAPECPCILNNSDVYVQLQSELFSLGLSAEYGAMGCRAYDANQSMFGCESNAGAHCTNTWCYVDMKFCPLHEDLCKADGATPGSDDSPHCRTRRAVASSLVNMSFSYETCGSMNVYSSSRHSEGVGGYSIKIAVFPWAPWVVERSSGYGGASYDFFVESLKLFIPEPTVRIIPGWATEQSRQVFSSSYTACVHDVAIGNFDLCIADLWLTPERNQLSTFVPPIRHDYFYLVVPKEKNEITFWTRLQAPFSPFTGDAWLSVLSFVCGMSALLWLVRLWETGFFCNPWGRISWSLVEFGRLQFKVWHDFLLGTSSHESEKGLAHQLFSVAFAFFVLVTLASYTASLASMLVIRRSDVGTIADIQEAIDQEVTICIPTVLSATFESMYPLAKFEKTGFVEHSPRLMHAGKCGAMVFTQDLIDYMYAGGIKDADCSSGLSEEVARCHYDYLGNERDDCNLIRTGELLWSVPLSFPVSDRISHSMSWAFTTGLTGGLLEEMKENKLNKDEFPVSRCDTAVQSSGGGITADDLSGTIYISVFIAILGLLCLVGKGLRKSSAAAASHPPEAGKGAGNLFGTPQETWGATAEASAVTADPGDWRTTGA